MDYMEGGPVMTRDALERGRCIPEPLALQYFRDMCKVGLLSAPLHPDSSKKSFSSSTPLSALPLALSPQKIAECAAGVYAADTATCQALMFLCCANSQICKLPRIAHSGQAAKCIHSFRVAIKCSQLFKCLVPAVSHAVPPSFLCNPCVKQSAIACLQAADDYLF